MEEFTWFVQIAESFNFVESIHFSSYNIGYAFIWRMYAPPTPYQGFIIKTKNGGDSWFQQLMTDAGYTKIYFVDELTGWLVGYGGSILHTINGGEVPVELISFTAVNTTNNVLLRWSTVTETNNKGFDIERSFNEEEWKAIRFELGNGTTTEIKTYSFEDKNLPAGRYSYRLKQIDFDGSFEYSDIVEVEISTPSKFELFQNYPNPFNPTTKIKFTIPFGDSPLLGGARGGLVTLKIYDVLGYEVATIFNEKKEAGSYEVEFIAEKLSSGIFFYQLRAGSFVETKKMLLLR